MKYNYFLLVIILVFIMPCLCVRDIIYDGVTEETEKSSNIETESVFSIRIKEKEQVTELDLEDYVLGVVLGEMPASFEPEALKAQAVATRTYTLRKITKQDKHENADICTDATCCQAYLSESDYLALRGTKADFRKVETAVYETEGQVLYYQDELI